MDFQDDRADRVTHTSSPALSYGVLGTGSLPLFRALGDVAYCYGPLPHAVHRAERASMQ
jgi:hypothetical protein